MLGKERGKEWRSGGRKKNGPSPSSSITDRRTNRQTDRQTDRQGSVKYRIRDSAVSDT